MFSFDEIAFYGQVGFWLATGIVGCMVAVWVCCVAFSYAIGRMDFVGLEEENAGEISED